MYQGYTQPEKKHCIRCHAVHEDQLYQLCPLCREGDDLADFFDAPRSEAEREMDDLAEDEDETQDKFLAEMYDEIAEARLCARFGTQL